MEGKKNWIAKALGGGKGKKIRHPGALRNAARKSGQSTAEYAREHEHDSGKTGSRARLAETLMSLNK